MEFCKEASIKNEPCSLWKETLGKLLSGGGHIDVLAVNVSEIAEMVNTGQLRALAVQNDKRSAELPDVPTLRKLGYPLLSRELHRGDLPHRRYSCRH